MKHAHTLLILLMLVAPLRAQDVRYNYDEQCGCDILFVDGIETTRDGKRYGFRLEDGTQIVPNIYLYVDRFRDGYCKVMPEDTLCGLIDRTGATVVPCIYQDVAYPSDGRVLVTRGDKMGFTDLQGREVIPTTLRYAGSFSEGCAPVVVEADSGRWGCTFIDTMGRILFPPTFDNLQPFTCGYALVCREGKWGVMDHQGNIVLPIVYDQVSTAFDTLLFAGTARGMALFDKQMHQLTEPVYTTTRGISDDRILVERDGRQGFLDRTGREVIPCIYDEVGPFNLCRAVVRIGDRFGIIDTAGRIVLPIEYESKSPYGRKYTYHDSLALVEKDGRLGYVDLDGNLAIPFYFDNAYHFTEGLASVCRDGMWGYIDTHGDLFLPLVFDIALPFEWGRAEVIYQGIVRKMDRRGRCVKNCKGIIAWRDPEQ